MRAARFVFHGLEGYVFAEDGRVFLLYTVAGESDIAIAEVFLDA